MEKGREILKEHEEFFKQVIKFYNRSRKLGGDFYARVEGYAKAIGETDWENLLSKFFTIVRNDIFKHKTTGAPILEEYDIPADEKQKFIENLEKDSEIGLYKLRIGRPFPSRVKGYFLSNRYLAVKGEDGKIRLFKKIKGEPYRFIDELPEDGFCKGPFAISGDYLLCADESGKELRLYNLKNRKLVQKETLGEKVDKFATHEKNFYLKFPHTYQRVTIEENKIVFKESMQNLPEECSRVQTLNSREPVELCKSKVERVKIYPHAKKVIFKCENETEWKQYSFDKIETLQKEDIADVALWGKEKIIWGYKDFKEIKSYDMLKEEFLEIGRVEKPLLSIEGSPDGKLWAAYYKYFDDTYVDIGTSNANTKIVEKVLKNEQIKKMKFTDDGHLFILGNGKIFFFDGEEKQFEKMNIRCKPLSLDVYGNSVVFGCDDGTIFMASGSSMAYKQIYRGKKIVFGESGIQTISPYKQIYRGKKPIEKIALIHKENHYFILYNEGEELHLIRLKGNNWKIEEIYSIDWNGEIIEMGAISKDTFVIATPEGFNFIPTTIELRNALSMVSTPFYTPVTAIAKMDDKYLFVSTEDGFLRVWDSDGNYKDLKIPIDKTGIKSSLRQPPGNLAFYVIPEKDILIIQRSPYKYWGSKGWEKEFILIDEDNKVTPGDDANIKDMLEAIFDKSIWKEIG